jgi:hypothetical protein
MIKPRHSEECHRCQLFGAHLGEEYVVCGIHPLGPAEIPCLDFTEITEQCEPLAAIPNSTLYKRFSLSS